MAKDWKRLGQAVKRAREQRGMTQTELAEATGQDDSTIQNLETARYGRGFSRMPSSAKLVAAHFGWADHSLKDILAGGEPTPSGKTPPSGTLRPAPTVPPAFEDPRYQEIWELPLPLEERERVITEMMKRDLERAKGREAHDGAPEDGRYAG